MDDEIDDKLLLSFVAFLFSTVVSLLKFYSKRKRLVATTSANIIIFVVTAGLHNFFGQCINVCQLVSWFLVYFSNCSENEETKFKKVNMGSYSDEDQIVWGLFIFYNIWLLPYITFGGFFKDWKDSQKLAANFRPLTRYRSTIYLYIPNKQTNF